MEIIGGYPQFKMIPDINTLINDFIKASKFAGVNLSRNALSFEKLPAPHKPPSSLPKGKMAIYMFFLKEECLKVGKIGPKSQARYTSHHYNPNSSKSNLANSINSAPEKFGLSDVSESEIGLWIKSKVDRVNILMDSGWGIPVLTFLESFLQCRLKPRFEGFESQKLDA